MPLIHSPDDPSHINNVELLLQGIICGLVVENCINAIAIILKLRCGRSARREQKENSVPLLMLANNAANIVYSLTSPFIFYNQVTCAPMARLCNFSSHVFFLTYDIFVLFAAYIISNRHVWVKNVSAVLVLNRFGWAVYDIYESYGYFDIEFQFCEYAQHPISAYYNMADIASDCFATLVTILVAILRLGGRSNVSVRLIERNLLRSIIIVATSIFIVFMGLNWVNQFWIGWGFAFQAYVLARLMNLDLMYGESLDKRLQKKTVLQFMFKDDFIDSAAA
ncbi:hypothetical protein CcCBS67573_g02280 [Chytriomyces confervae]|uniref:G-protein coupled receptors family 1 profile domain-containing protein n=1 Tax=Chytriomyces confervae TaxID=246404 RepID=A0A507FL84_9FUNG|nr:hypothetical protein HDU80_005048 [Chytriomyces hyalinus]TPX76470.1 hypothetical protein CcCBS67573_g02280 [Chytriomyces confervae]